MKVTSIVPSLFDRLETGTYDALTRKILTLSQAQSVRVALLYYANLEMQGLFTRGPLSQYVQTLEYMDIVAADGIALTTLYTAWKRPDIGALSLLSGSPQVAETISNMNGTDFIPYLLSHISSKDSYRLVMFGSPEPILQKAVEYARRNFGFETVGQNGWGDPFDPVQLSSNKTNIVLVARGSPKQEYWIQEHESLWQKQHTIVIGVGGLFEFWGGYEIRAPRWVRSLSLEWLWRAIIDPKKNLNKSLTSLKFFIRLFQIVISR